MHASVQKEVDYKSLDSCLYVQLLSTINKENILEGEDEMIDFDVKAFVKQENVTTVALEDAECEAVGDELLARYCGFVTERAANIRNDKREKKAMKKWFLRQNKKMVETSKKIQKMIMEDEGRSDSEEEDSEEEDLYEEEEKDEDSTEDEEYKERSGRKQSGKRKSKSKRVRK